MITSTLQPSGTRTNGVVDDYFSKGFRKQEWLGGTVYKNYRSIDTDYRALQIVGFCVNGFLRISRALRLSLER
ncbi:hypothetical protein Q5741_19895 [Paenibacillus sp. JX-17]|uniref:Transposase n=1 Tax=Paenibacillus lacisoli TaxID=3064525 RepID=A0ABT9CHC5_9BACL|nr:hypothetical protein [Paenibacillus sp. JX-17]MDO7908655.1 hypothetical protein [Paenibacillus sp. JX-17]